MELKSLPTEFFDLLPIPVAVTLPQAGNVNSDIIYVNQCFIDELGWQLSDVPDKYTWWKKAYPDPDYQKVVQRQWELSVTDAKEAADRSVSIEVNITTKSHQIKRYKVSSFLNDDLCAGCNVVLFTRLANS